MQNGGAFLVMSGLRWLLFLPWMRLGPRLARLEHFFGVSLPRLAGFASSWHAPGSILKGSRWLWGGFWNFQNHISQCFYMHARLRSRNALNDIVTNLQF